ncbi:hypothetical protein QF031_002214 [Pseudarthrobacter defluvii]|nr:hypothetical protein [Pseudarthrobacter defluvii]MDQ0769465.1 hypothetical protein [Pseudarthrobacter defluvii]
MTVNDTRGREAATGAGMVTKVDMLTGVTRELTCRSLPESSALPAEALV